MRENIKNLMVASTKIRLQEQFETLKLRLQERGKQIGETGGTSDWHDNFAFDQAHRDFELAQKQVRDMEVILRTAEIIKPNFAQDKIGIGHAVDTESTDGKFTYTILGPNDSDPNRGWISYQTPVAQRLLGHKRGDQVVLPGESGEIRSLITNFRPGEF